MSSPALSGPAAAPAALPRHWRDKVWAGTQFAATSQPALPTGHAALDAELPGGGWPASGLTELLFDAPGSGEWRLLAPALRAQAARRPVVCVAPPLLPYAPALRALGLPLQRFVWVTPPGAAQAAQAAHGAQAAADAAWALEQALRSGGCGAALWWGEAGTTMLRRLHLAALEHGCLLWVLRPLAARRQASPAPLRLACSPLPRGRLAVDVFKRRGPAQAAPLQLQLPPVAGLEHPMEAPDHAVARVAPAVAAA
ncbi:MAG TPA: translesion DNA synthesis-associated protein ImuA [Rubrivivax sp.]|nr:translesion DNA synthesis-associated protein ImuA [Rubrivivax sp.]